MVLSTTRQQRKQLFFTLLPLFTLGTSPLISILVLVLHLLHLAVKLDHFPFELVSLSLVLGTFQFFLD